MPDIIWMDYEILTLVATSVHPSNLGVLPPSPWVIAKKAQIMGFALEDVCQAGEYLHQRRYDEQGSFLVTTLKQLPKPWVALPFGANK
jgi:hypothetical protein